MKGPSAKIENEYKDQGYKIIAGLDEAGKGAWAGPVVSAAVILEEDISLPKLNDSKKISKKVRDDLYALITEKAVAWGVGIQDAIDVDEKGLAEAHRCSMRMAVENLGQKVDLLLVDGLGIKQLGTKSICIVKGDQKVRSIAAASVLAKVTRDRLMEEFHEEMPHYGFSKHKGYGTAFHQEALSAHGISKIHRLSYSTISKFMQQSMFDLV